jgi:hypothetical protein
VARWRKNIMLHRYRLCTRQIAVSLSFGLAAVGWLSVASAAAQGVSSAHVISAPLQLPKGPSTPGFDITRLNTENYGAFEPFFVKDAQSLSKALEDGTVAMDTRLLVTETAAGRLALLTDQMAYHHLAQGRDGGKDWMATF